MPQEVGTSSTFRNAWLSCLAVALAGCAAAPTIQPAASSASRFEHAVYKGETAVIRGTTPGATEYRVFRQGATGFVSIQSVRDDAEQSATEFCQRTAKGFLALRETVATPPFILGNFPRIEIVFECTGPAPNGAAAPANSKYARIAELKKLLDSGALTQTEFESEKLKILAEP